MGVWWEVMRAVNILGKPQDYALRIFASNINILA
jgi:hypothetical protein